jgi:hypothetical protein
MIESGIRIRAALVEELPLLSEIELAAAILFANTPYGFLVDAPPLLLEFVRAQSELGLVWVAIDPDRIVVGYGIAREVDNTLYLQS